MSLFAKKQILINFKQTQNFSEESELTTIIVTKQNSFHIHHFSPLFQFNVQNRLTVGTGIYYTENFFKCFYREDSRYLA